MAIQPEQEHTFPPTYSRDTAIDPEYLRIIRALEDDRGSVVPRPGWRVSVVRRFLEQVEPVKDPRRLISVNFTGNN